MFGIYTFIPTKKSRNNYMYITKLDTDWTSKYKYNMALLTVSLEQSSNKMVVALQVGVKL